MGWESSGVVRFDLGPLLEGQMRTAKLKSAYNLLIIGPTGFGALSLRWIQFASVFRCARSSLFLVCIWQLIVINYEKNKGQTSLCMFVSVLSNKLFYSNPISVYMRSLEYVEIMF